jgi:S-adenosylmethionine:tRNA ribosyltransferase-isomerase
MDQVQNISILDYTYPLEDGQIASYGLPQRDQSRLLIWRNGELTDEKFANLPNYLPEQSMVVFNNTQVIKARLFFKKLTGAKIEIFCLEPINPIDYSQSFAQTERCRWKCIIGNLKKWKDEILEQHLTIGGKPVLFKAQKVRPLLSNTSEIEFSWDNPLLNFAELLESAGNIPIPPYLNRESETIDLESYQTVYSRIKGSVAAPTAGLHFTPEIITGLQAKNIDCKELTLHVGAGTFQPVKAETIGGHEMHTEHFILSQTLINELASFAGKIIAVGTTSVRTLESIYFIGCKVIENQSIKPEQLAVAQWEPYRAQQPIYSRQQAFKGLSDYLTLHKLAQLNSSTSIMIVPGYNFKVIGGMVTNFHQPQSTLLLLIAAFLGDEWKRIYAHALKNNYRFLSYGDSNLYLK